MAGIFKTLGSALTAVDTIAASGSRRLSVWAREQECQTKYRHVSAMQRIFTDSAIELSAELKRFNASMGDPDIKAACDVLRMLDKTEADAAARDN